MEQITFFFFSSLARNSCSRKRGGYRGQVTNTALLQSMATTQVRGLGLLPNGCDVHAGEDNKVSKCGVRHHVVYEDFGQLLPVRPQLRPREDLQGEQSWGRAGLALEGAVNYCEAWCGAGVLGNLLPHQPGGLNRGFLPLLGEVLQVMVPPLRAWGSHRGTGSERRQEKQLECCLGRMLGES